MFAPLFQRPIILRLGGVVPLLPSVVAMTAASAEAMILASNCDALVIAVSVTVPTLRVLHSVGAGTAGKGSGLAVVVILTAPSAAQAAARRLMQAARRPLVGLCREGWVLMVGFWLWVTECESMK